jgi:hypothetical protein
MFVRGSPGSAAFGSCITTQHDKEDNGDHHPDWCDEEICEQLGTGFWEKAASQGRRRGQEVRTLREQESVKEQAGHGPSERLI